MSDTFYVIDVFAIVFQVFHAIPSMTGPAGQPTNAVFGFTRDLLTILRNKHPAYLLCAMESPTAGVRGELYPEYKANRSEMPDELRPQVPMIMEIMRGFGIPCVSCDGWEADDVIATVTRLAKERDIDVRIVTNDKDARQLLGPKVQLFNVRKDEYMDEAKLMQEWGVRPDQVIDFQSLVGDSVDNIPGVPLVGPKKASGLLAKFDSLDEILAHPDEAPGPALQRNLKQYADQARLSRQLATLNTELPIEVDWEAARVKSLDVDRLMELFTEFGFRRFGDEVRELAGTPEGRQQRERTSVVIDSPEKFGGFLEKLREQKKFCLDLETTSAGAMRAEIVGWAFSWDAGQGYYLPVQGPKGQAVLDGPMVLEGLRPILESPDVEIVNHDIKYEMIVLKRAGIQLGSIGMDPMVGSYLLDAGARSHGLDALSDQYLGHKTIPLDDVTGSGKSRIAISDVDVEQIAECAVENAEIAWQLADSLGNRLQKEGLGPLYWDLERPLIGVLAEMEFTGIRVDVEELKRQSENAGRSLERLIAEIYEIAGHEFNIDSPLQLRQVLFSELHLPILKKTKTGASTDQSVLEKLAELHELPAKITQHRQVSKLKNTYLDALPQMVNPATGKIHASFNQVVAATGRLSSSDPNLQNIPVRTQEGRLVRKAFIPSEEGWRFLCADYSQIELRLLAEFSQDEVLLAAFDAGHDVHTAVAAEIYSIDPSAVDGDMRRVAKAVNFGVLYGQSPFGLAENLKITQLEAAKYIGSYFQRYKGVDHYLSHLLQECAETGYARTILGRRRAIQGIRSTTGRQRNLPERTAINTVIQGSAADLIKKAMINVSERLAREKHPARMVLQIHDELVFDAPGDSCQELADIVRDEMCRALPMEVPIVVDVSVGDNWLDAKPV